MSWSSAVGEVVIPHAIEYHKRKMFISDRAKKPPDALAVLFQTRSIPHPSSRPETHSCHTHVNAHRHMHTESLCNCSQLGNVFLKLLVIRQSAVSHKQP